MTKRIQLTCGAIFCAAVILAQESPLPNPIFPFGAVYFRKSNPPEQDWERDHKTAAQMGMNIFRHWFMWASIENAPGRYDWRDYDHMVELEGQNHIKVIIAEVITGAPEWMWDKYPHARQVASDGSESFPAVGGSSATSSAPLCLDNDDVRDQAGKFLTALVERYRDKPATMGYDVWNEGSMQECFCKGTQAKFREWLKAKYGTIETLGRAWHRYSYADWEAVHPPHNTGGYPDSLDWLAFRRDDAIRLLHWRTELIRRLDKRNKVTAHSTGLLTEIEWRTAADVDSYGYTWVASRHTNDPWMQFHAVDIVRAGSRGKPFWHAEATGGPLWLQPQVINRPLEDGRSSDDKDVRVWSLIDMTAGATGILFTRWRPLLDGPLFGAFGPMGMDGSVTPRAEMASTLARWANSHPDIWKSRPSAATLASSSCRRAPTLASSREVEASRPAAGAEEEEERRRGGRRCQLCAAAQGASQAFFDSNIQADFVGIDDIGEYPMSVVQKRTFTLRPDWEIQEYSCEENNRGLFEGRIKVPDYQNANKYRTLSGGGSSRCCACPSCNRDEPWHACAWRRSSWIREWIPSLRRMTRSPVAPGVRSGRSGRPAQSSVPAPRSSLRNPDNESRITASRFLDLVYRVLNSPEEARKNA